MAERRTSQGHRPPQPCNSDHSMSSDTGKEYNNPDEALTTQLTHRSVRDYNSLLTASPSYTILEGKTDLLIANDLPIPDRPITVAFPAINDLTNAIYTPDQISWEIPNKPRHKSNTDITGKHIDLCPVEYKKDSRHIFQHLNQEGFIMNKSGQIAFTIHFNNNQNNTDANQLSRYKTLPPLKRDPDKYREYIKLQRELTNTVRDSAVQLVMKRDKVLDKIKSSHRVPSRSAERNKEDKVDKTIRLEDKRRRKAAAEARKYQDLSHDQLGRVHDTDKSRDVLKPHRNICHLSRLEESTSNGGSRASGVNRFKGSAKRRERKSKKN